MITAAAGSHLTITDSESADVEALTCRDMRSGELDYTVTVA